jgi:hypothetical protein
MPTTLPFDYARTTALVTGASRGIGASLARELATRGCPHIVLVARTESDLLELAAELSARHGTRTHVVTADLSDPAAAEKIKAETDRLGLAVGLLVNNAGFGDWGPYTDRPLDRQEKMVAVNCTSLVALTRLFLPDMVAQGRGGVLNVASTAAFQPVAYMSVYGATKAFVLSFSEALWSEMADKQVDVRVVCLCPGGTDTAFDFGDAGARGSYENTPMSTPEEVAKAGIRALERNASYAVVGATNYFGALGARFLPRAAIARVAAALFRPDESGQKRPPRGTLKKVAITGAAVAAGAVAVGVALKRNRRR